MQVPRPAPSNLPPQRACLGRVTTRSLEDLPHILDEGTNVVCVRRRLPGSARRALERAASGDLFAFKIPLDARDVRAVFPRLDVVGDATARAVIERDLEAIVPRYAAVVGRRHLALALAVTNDDACRKLHADRIGIRLLCTYAGPGTEWVDDADAHREHLGRTDVTIEEHNRLVADATHIRRAEAGDVVLLKGDAWPGVCGHGAIHRSPPIAARGLRRLVLKLDQDSCGC